MSKCTRNPGPHLAARSVFRLLCRLALVLLIPSTAVPQADPASAAGTVEVRLQLNWWTKSPQERPSAATVALQPLGSKGPAQTLHISEGSPAIARVPPGRYQLMTTVPVVIDGQAYGWSIELPLTAPVNDIRLSQENAVRVRLGDHFEAAAAHSEARPVSPGTIDSQLEITALLNRWVSSFRTGNLRAQMSCYAPQVARYLELRNVSRAQIQRQKEKLLRRYPQFRQLSLNDIDVASSGEEATATAVKSWRFSGPEVSSQGQAMIYFQFTKAGSNWVISAEQEQPIAQGQVAARQSAKQTGTP